MEVKWCGFDYGQCIMQPGAMRNQLVFGDIYKELGQPELIADKIRKHRILKEKYGTYGFLGEVRRDEVNSYVLGNDPEAVDLFDKKEQELLLMAEGLEDTLAYLQRLGIELHVVSEMKRNAGPVGSDAVSCFLKSRGLVKYFKGLITPRGKIDFDTDSLDPKYRGCTKKEGTIYDVLAQELSERGISPDEAVIVGDEPDTDINPARERGFRTIQYKGFVDLGESNADLVIHSFEELRSSLTRKN